jgi:hypothetical protein
VRACLIASRRQSRRLVNLPGPVRCTASLPWSSLAIRRSVNLRARVWGDARCERAGPTSILAYVLLNRGGAGSASIDEAHRRQRPNQPRRRRGRRAYRARDIERSRGDPQRTHTHDAYSHRRVVTLRQIPRCTSISTNQIEMIAAKPLSKGNVLMPLPNHLRLHDPIAANLVEGFDLRKLILTVAASAFTVFVLALPWHARRAQPSAPALARFPP